MPKVVEDPEKHHQIEGAETAGVEIVNVCHVRARAGTERRPADLNPHFVLKIGKVIV